MPGSACEATLAQFAAAQNYAPGPSSRVLAAPSCGSLFLVDIGIEMHSLHAASTRSVQDSCAVCVSGNSAHNTLGLMPKPPPIQISTQPPPPPKTHMPTQPPCVITPLPVCRKHDVCLWLPVLVLVRQLHRVGHGVLDIKVTHLLMMEQHTARHSTAWHGAWWWVQHMAQRDKHSSVHSVEHEAFCMTCTLSDGQQHCALYHHPATCNERTDCLGVVGLCHVLT